MDAQESHNPRTPFDLEQALFGFMSSFLSHFCFSLGSVPWPEHASLTYVEPARPLRRQEDRGPVLGRPPRL